LAADLEGKLAAARLLTSGITVPVKLLRPHRVIAAWIEERRRRRQEARTDPWRRMSDVPDFSVTGGMMSLAGRWIRWQRRLFANC